MCYTGSLEQKTPQNLLSLSCLQALFGMHELFWLYFAKTSMTKKGSFFREQEEKRVHALVERLARNGNVHQRDRVG